jgi:hypothetical protein
LQLGKSDEWLQPEILDLEECAELPSRALGNGERTRRSQRLKAGGKVGRFADDIVLDNLTADDNQPGSNPDARLKLFGELKPPPDRSAPTHIAWLARHRLRAPADSRSKRGFHRPYSARQTRRNPRPFPRRNDDTSR